MSADQGDWADYVGRVEFSCNVATHLLTKGSSFMVAYEVYALQPTNLAFDGAHLTLEFNQNGEDLAKKREQVLKMTKLLVEKARKCYKVQVNARRHQVKNKVGQKVLLNVNNLI